MGEGGEEAAPGSNRVWGGGGRDGCRVKVEEEWQGKTKIFD
jgi:hypothetical protein